MKILKAIWGWLIAHFTYDSAKDPAHPDFVQEDITMAPTALTEELPEPIKVDTSWCGGPYEDRMEMYYLAKTVCAQEKIGPELTRDLLATIYGESGFNKNCLNDRNKNGTVDYGICQFNTGTNKHGQAYWIGKGAAFKDKDEVLSNPEKCIRVMAREFKVGHQHYWMAYPHRQKYWDKEPK